MITQIHHLLVWNLKIQKIKELNSDICSDGDQEMKEIESDDEFDTVFQNDKNYATPMGIEGGQLQFSGLDLNKGMIEIQNMGESNIGLDGYSLCNKSGEKQYDLPKDMILESKQKLRIYVGKDMCDQLCDMNNKQNDVEKSKKFVGNYDGVFVFWGCDVGKVQMKIVQDYIIQLNKKLHELKYHLNDLIWLIKLIQKVDVLSCEMKNYIDYIVDNLLI